MWIFSLFAKFHTDGDCLSECCLHWNCCYWNVDHGVNIFGCLLSKVRWSNCCRLLKCQVCIFAMQGTGNVCWTTVLRHCVPQSHLRCDTVLPVGDQLWFHTCTPTSYKDDFELNYGLIVYVWIRIYLFFLRTWHSLLVSRMVKVQRNSLSTMFVTTCMVCTTTHLRETNWFSPCEVGTFEKVTKRLVLNVFLAALAFVLRNTRIRNSC